MQTLLQSTSAYSLIKREYEEGKLSHAYLFVCNDGRNLRLLLKTFAKLLLHCADGNTEHEKQLQKRIDEDNYSDCLSFPSDDKKLTVEDAEKILEESALRAAEGDKKIFLISDFADANVQTQNKLLKVLEEPPVGTLFLLGATTTFPILPTVLSRVKKIELQPFSTEQITRCLARLYPDKTKEQLSLFAAAANGSVGEAQNLLEGGYYKTLIEQAFALTLSTPQKLPQIVKEAGETKHPKELLALLRLIFRDALLLKMQAEKDPSYAFKSEKTPILLRAERENLLKIRNAYPLPALLYAQSALDEAEKQLKFNAVFPQCLEILMAKIRAKTQA